MPVTPSPSPLARTTLPPFQATFERLVAKVGALTPPDEALAMHRAFEARTGAFGPDDPWFESRSRAFWDDTLTRARPEAAASLPLLEPDELVWASALRRAHRGLFQADVGSEIALTDVLTGAELVVHEVDEATRDGLASTESLFDGTVVAVASPLRAALLPGAIFHPEGAEEAILAVVVAARERAMSSGALLDALLRMELSLRTLSRVKMSYAYRAGALAG